MKHDDLGFLDGWVGLIRNVYAQNQEELDAIADPVQWNAVLWN